MASSSSRPIAFSATLPMASPSSQPAASSSQFANDLTWYLPLYKAILEGNLKSVIDFCGSDGSALEANITVNMDTALHVAVGTGRANHIVRYILEKKSSEEMTQKNNEGNTILSIAAIVGNVEAAKMIMKKDVHLNLIEAANKSRWIPLIEAARHGQKKMIEYLLPFSRNYLMYVTVRRFVDNWGFLR